MATLESDRVRARRAVVDEHLRGENRHDLEAVMATHEIWNKRISTGRLNRWLAPVVEATPPPAVSGRRIKIRYMTQPKARPPFFVLFPPQERIDRLEATVAAAVDLLHSLLHPEKASKPGTPKGRG